ncbi:PREDICTED: uncharacterized protein LOC105359492 [Ceratosolen solmsi marchali]|uniref:Uncharacterized protein LOC105359492 n=1 Tax=Ceratosolen solmsi marchali TaxID=326594 RepID=A0AAJ6VM01_9HYME|nr:PREDICTED: uncharacterized protein LOC105359492 [Ceratosolen solmsi marchali]
MAVSRTSLIEQKQIQWAKEREEMSRLTRNHAPLENCSTTHTSIRTYSNGTRISLTEMNGKQHPRYASTISLRSLGSDIGSVSTTSLVNLQEQLELERTLQRRSPSLPPIYKHEHRYRVGEQQHCQRPSRSTQHTTLEKLPQQRCSRAPEEREGETSGYASDSLEGPIQKQQQSQQRTLVLPCHVNCGNPEVAMGEKTWQNPYQSDENSLPSSRRLASLRIGEFNRQRWGGVWGQETSKDLPAPSWLERGLSRLDHNSQVLVINHDSASSPDSSTTGSLGSDINKTYLRGQNLPIDANILQEREIKRQKALELQTAIKQQLEEREKQRREDKEKKLKDERAEEERIRRERDLEKQRFEDEQRKQREREAAKLKKTRALQEILEAAERKAKEEKYQRRRHGDSSPPGTEANNSAGGEASRSTLPQQIDKEAKETHNRRELNASIDSHESCREPGEALQLPVSQDVAIVLSGRIEDPELLDGKSPLRLVNLVVRPSPRTRLEADLGSGDLGALLDGLGSSLILQATRRTSPLLVGNRLLTPSKYRIPSGRDCSTQTDCEDENVTDFAEKVRAKEGKERKDASNITRKEVEKSMSTGPSDESTIKTLLRNKSQVRMSLESRPRWNANRPGTRYRTQSEKDPHYQRRMRMRRRLAETSDEGSSDFRRSPSPNRRKYNIGKAKLRNSVRHKVKIDNYDANLSMESLSSLVPLHTDKNGRIHIGENGESEDIWCNGDILSHLTSLRNGLIIKKREWDLQECPISPITELY